MSRRRIFLIVWLVMGVLCIGGGTYFAGRLLLLHRALVLRDAGLAAQRAGDDATAADLLIQYIHRRPSDLDAMKVYIQSRQRVPMTSGQEFADTISVLKVLLAQQPDQIDDRRYLMELYVQLERGPEALDLADAILRAIPNDAKTLELKTQVLIGENKFQEAQAVAQRWAAAAPDDLQAQIAQLSIGFSLHEPSDVLVAKARQQLALNPDNVRSQILLGFAMAKSGDAAGARTMFQTAAAHPDLSDEIARILVAQFDDLDQFADALKVLQNRVSHGGGSDLRDDLVQRLWESGRWQDVAETLKNVRPADPSLTPTLLALKALSLSKLDRNKEAAEIRKALAGETRPDAVAWNDLLSLLIDMANVSDKQIAGDCNTAVRFEVRNPYLLYYLGDAQTRLGELDLAIDAFAKASGCDAHWTQPASRLVECLLVKGQSEQALDVATYLFRRNPNDPNAIIALVQAWAAGIEKGDLGRSDDLLKLVAEAQNQLPGEHRILPILKVQVLANQGQKEQAAQAAREAIAMTPTPPEQVFRIIANLSRRYDLGVEEDCCAAWQKAYGITSSLALVQAMGRASAGHPEDGLKLFDQLAGQSGKSGEMGWQLARAEYLDAIASADAKSAWTKLRDAYPNERSVQEAAAGATAVRGDWNFMQPVIDHLHALTGDNALTWRLTEASMLIQYPRSEEDYDKGSVELSSLIESYPELAQPHELLAQALIHMKRLDGAIDQLIQVTQLQPTSVTASLQLASLEQTRGDVRGAEQELERIIPQLHTLRERDQVAELLSRLGLADRAVQVLEQPMADVSSTTQPSDDPNQELLRAELYHQLHQDDKADVAARDLIEHPDLASVLFAANLFYGEGRAADAENALHLLDKMTLEPGMKELAWGNFCFSTRHDPVAAETHLTAALHEAPHNAGAWQALAMCQVAEGNITRAMATISQGNQAAPEDASLAALKNDIPLLVQASSDGTLATQVAAIVAKPLDADPAIELVKMVIEEHQASNFEQLASRLNQFIGRHADYAPAQLALAQCYMDMGRIADAIATADRGMALFPNDSGLAQAATTACSRAGRWADMLAAAQNWKARSPSSAETADTATAIALINLGNSSSAIHVLQPYLPVAKVDPDHHAGVIEQLAQAEVSAANIASASDLLWPLAGKAAVWRAVWIRASRAIGDPKQAADWLHQVQSIIPSDALHERADLAQAFNQAGQSHKDPNLIATASELFTELTQDPNADALVFIMAGGQAQQTNRNADAEAYYRKALALDPSMWLAQNNIAMLILQRGGDVSEAEKLAQSAVNGQSRRPEVYDTLAEVEAKAGKPQAAADAMRVAIQLQPDSLLWRLRLARYLLDSGQLAAASKAITELDAAIPDVRNQPPEVQQQLAEIRKEIHGQGT